MIGFAIFAAILFIFLVGLVVYLYPGRPNRLSSVPGLDPSDKKTGNLPDINDAGGLHPFLKELHEDYGPIASFWWGEQFVVSTAHPDTFRPQMNLFDRPVELFLLFKPLIGENSIQYANGAEGRELRRTLDRAFSHEACQSYVQTIIDVSSFPSMSKAADGLCSQLEKSTKDQHVPLRQYMMVSTFRSILSVGFGDYFTSDDACLEFVKNYDICWHEMEQRMENADAATNPARLQQFEKALSSLKHQMRDVIKNRKEAKESPDFHDCHRFVDELIALCTSEEQEFDVGITYLVGGFHTTGNLMTWMVYFLLTHPECEQKLRDELETELGAREITADDINRLTYCRQVIDESLRLSVLGPYAARFSSVDLKVGDHIIPKETPIVQALGCAFSDPSLWPAPTEFDPDRFHPDRLKRVDSLACPFFGFAGKRKCPGFRLAYTEALVFLSFLFRRFRMKLVNPDAVVTPVYGLVTRPDDEIWITVESAK